MMPKLKVFKSRKAAEAFYDPARDGVTFSLLSTFLTCREKTRLYLEGWSGTMTSFPLVYGSMVHHVLQMAYRDRHNFTPENPPTATWVRTQLEALRKTWIAEHPNPHPKAVEIVEEAVMKAGVMLPAYFRYWAREDFGTTSWAEVEQTFSLPWTVTTRQGKTLNTFLRGRIDAAYTLPKSKRPTALRLLETKTRSVVDELTLVDTMPHERQTNTYLSALRMKTGKAPATVLLNIQRKPLLRQKQSETAAQFEARIAADVRDRPEWYFIRMEMSVNAQDINRSEEELNDLITDFLLWRAGESGHYKNSNACVQPGYGACQYLKVCSHGDFHGLEKRDVIFRELEDE
jgi:hypothetical protein